MNALVYRLENHYDFQCEAGPLKMCQEWGELKTEIVAAQKDAEHQQTIIMALVGALDHLRNVIRGDASYSADELAQTINAAIDSAMKEQS